MKAVVLLLGGAALAGLVLLGGSGKKPASPPQGGGGGGNPPPSPPEDNGLESLGCDLSDANLWPDQKAWVMSQLALVYAGKFDDGSNTTPGAAVSKATMLASADRFDQEGSPKAAACCRMMAAQMPA